MFYCYSLHPCCLSHLLCLVPVLLFHSLAHFLSASKIACFHILHSCPYSNLFSLLTRSTFLFLTHLLTTCNVDFPLLVRKLQQFFLLICFPSVTFFFSLSHLVRPCKFVCFLPYLLYLCPFSHLLCLVSVFLFHSLVYFLSACKLLVTFCY